MDIILRDGPLDGRLVDHAEYPEDFSIVIDGVEHVWQRQDPQAWRSRGTTDYPIYDYVGLAGQAPT